MIITPKTTKSTAREEQQITKNFKGQLEVGDDPVSKDIGFNVQ